MAHKFHVLLVEHDRKDRDKTLRMLHYYSYEVTTVKLASNALSILSKEKVKFDLVMANLDSPDSCGSQLLQDVVKRDLLLILMSDDDDSKMIMRAIKQGAFLCIKKPVTMETIEYLGQDVVRERVRRARENEQNEEVVEYHDMHKNVPYGNDNVIFKKKVWAEWSDELHQRFMVAAIQLGEGRCYPKEILELMNVPGLTRMQVASHLQKCRNAKWLPPSVRKTKPANKETTTPRNKARRSKTERFGSMPHLDNYSQLHIRQKYKHETNHHKFTINDPPTRTKVRGNSDEVYHPQHMLDHRNYPFSEHIETFNSGHLGRTFGAEGPLFTYGFRNPTPSDNSDDVTDSSMGQIFSTLQQESGMDYNGSLQSLVLDHANVNLNQMPMINATSEWDDEETESIDEDEIEDY